MTVGLFEENYQREERTASAETYTLLETTHDYSLPYSGGLREGREQQLSRDKYPFQDRHTMTVGLFGEHYEREESSD